VLGGGSRNGQRHGGAASASSSQQQFLYAGMNVEILHMRTPLLLFIFFFIKKNLNFKKKLPYVATASRS
jgi:hypothetical protein